MTSRTALLGAVAKLDAVYKALEGITQRSDGERRHELVQLRKELATQIAELASIAEPFFAAHADPAALKTFREKFGKMRTATASHQANWPAINLSPTDNAFRKSASAVFVASRDFSSWMRTTLMVSQSGGSI